MNTQQFRSWVETQVDTWHQSNFSTVPVFYENGALPDKDKVGPQWLDVSVSFIDGGEVTVGSRPRGRDEGSIKLMVYTKLGEGTQTSDALLDSLREYLRTNNRYQEAKLGFPRRHSAPAALGWHKAGLIIPFKSDVA
jgi:hypothetical protein